MVVLFFLSILYDNVGYCNDRGNLFAGKKVHCHQLLDTPDFRMLMLGFYARFFLFVLSTMQSNATKVGQVNLRMVKTGQMCSKSACMWLQMV